MWNSPNRGASFLVAVRNIAESIRFDTFLSVQPKLKHLEHFTIESFRSSPRSRLFLMLRRSLLFLGRRPLSTMASQTPMEDAMRAKVATRFQLLCTPRN